jgi:transposase-like protein
MRVITTELVETKRDERGRRITPGPEREAAVRAYDESGLTQKAFARREGIKYATLVSWLQRRRRERSSTPRPAFAEFTMAGGPGGLEVRLPDGVVIRGASVEDAAKLLRLVRC